MGSGCSGLPEESGRGLGAASLSCALRGQARTHSTLTPGLGFPISHGGVAQSCSPGRLECWGSPRPLHCCEESQWPFHV